MEIPGTTVGTTLDRPGLLAVTSNATRAYVPLEYTGRVAMVDLLARRPVDADASTATVDDINLPSGASPGAISIDPWDNYAYITDSGRGSIYVLDVNPDSASYNQVVRTISVNATSGLRQIAISSDGRKLFATAADGYIYAVNIDPEDQPTVPNSNPRKWWEPIGKVLTPNGAFGLAATPDPLKMVFTSGNTVTDGSGFGVLTVKDDPLNWVPTTLYTNLTLGSDVDFFDVNEGVAVTVTADGKYAFVAGRNLRGNTGSDPLAGGNIGIIQYPLGPNPKLVAATEPVPGSLTNNVALSGDGKYLIGSYPTLSGGGNAYVFDVGKITEAVENPGDYWIDGYYRGRSNLNFQSQSQRRATLNDLTRVPIEELNPLILPQNTTPAIPNLIATAGNPLGLLVASPKDPPNWPLKDIGSYWLSYTGTLNTTPEKRRQIFKDIINNSSVKKIYMDVLSPQGTTFKYKNSNEAMISGLSGQDVFAEFKDELDKYNKAHPGKPRDINVVGWFEGTGLALSSSPMYKAAQQALYSKVPGNKNAVLGYKDGNSVNYLDLLHPKVWGELQNIATDFIQKYGSFVKDIIFDDRLGIPKDAETEVANLHRATITADKDSDKNWIQRALTQNLTTLKKALPNTRFNISANLIDFAKRDQNQDVLKWLQSGLIDGEYNLQLYKNGSQFNDFVKNYQEHMTKLVKDPILKNKNIKSKLSVSIGYTALGKNLTRGEIAQQVDYLRGVNKEGPENPQVLNPSQIIGFDYQTIKNIPKTTS